MPHATPRRYPLTGKEWLPAPSYLRVALGVVSLLVLAVAVAPHLSIANLFTLNRSLAFGIIVLSMVPLIGYMNMLSLCQLSFGAIGALAMAGFAPGGSPLGLVAAFVSRERHRCPRRAADPAPPRHLPRPRDRRRSR